MRITTSCHMYDLAQLSIWTYLVDHGLHTRPKSTVCTSDCKPGISRNTNCGLIDFTVNYLPGSVDNSQAPEIPLHIHRLLLDFGCLCQTPGAELYTGLYPRSSFCILKPVPIYAVSSKILNSIPFISPYMLFPQNCS